MKAAYGGSGKGLWRKIHFKSGMKDQRNDEWESSGNENCARYSRTFCRYCLCVFFRDIILCFVDFIFVFFAVVPNSNREGKISGH